MWFKLVLVSYVALGGVQGGSFVFEQIARAISNNLICLERTPNLEFNATFPLAYGLGDLYRIGTSSDLDAGKRNVVDTLIARFDVFLQRARVAFSTNPLVQLIWFPQYWSLPQYGDFSFQCGRIPKTPLVYQSLTEIYVRSVITTESQACRTAMLVENGPSESLRKCSTPCIDQVKSTDFTQGFSPASRLAYLLTELFLNCTNNSPDETRALIQNICTHVKMQIDFMYYKREDPQFTDIYYYFLNKMTLCTFSGYSEFLSEDIVTLLLGSIECDGCVGSPDVYSASTRTVLTAQTAALLSSVLRMVAEEDYPSAITLEAIRG